VAEVMAGEQSCGTFTRVEGETDALRARARAWVESIVELAGGRAQPSAAQRAGSSARRHRARGGVRASHLSFPVANIGANLPTLAATVAGNLYDLGEVTGLRLESHAPARLRIARASSCRAVAWPARAR
jgi:ribulose-bisphosphate carboxylase large chain